MLGEVDKAVVRRVALRSLVSDPILGNLGTRRGIEFQVRSNHGDVVWKKQVWQNWVSLFGEVPRPFYARRLSRAERKAGHVAATLN